MYEYKKNLIQINPEYRKLFKDQYFKLFRFLPNPDMWDMTDYCLYVPDLKGKVNGFYYNWTFNEWGTVKRKLKKLLHCRKLDEIRIPMSMSEFQLYCKKDYLDLNSALLLSETFTENIWLKIIKKIENET